MANQCTKFQDSSFSRFGDILGGNKNLNGPRDHNHAPFRDDFVVGVLGLVTIQQCIIFEISTFTHYEGIKGDEKCRNWGGFGVRGHLRSLAT